MNGPPADWCCHSGRLSGIQPDDTWSLQVALKLSLSGVKLVLSPGKSLLRLIWAVEQLMINWQEPVSGGTVCRVGLHYPSGPLHFKLLWTSILATQE